jgi:hypothetical protein
MIRSMGPCLASCGTMDGPSRRNSNGTSSSSSFLVFSSLTRCAKGPFRHGEALGDGEGERGTVSVGHGARQ